LKLGKKSSSEEHIYGWLGKVMIGYILIELNEFTNFFSSNETKTILRPTFGKRTILTERPLYEIPLGQTISNH
jgi:hypothetical protein